MLLQHPALDKEPVQDTLQPLPCGLFPALAPAHSVLQDMELQELGLGLGGDGQLLCWPAECPDDDLLAFLGASGL
jgi:hypothetical protein